MVFSFSWPFSPARRARRALRQRAEALYGVAVAQARQPLFYQAYGVMDSPEGRFEMVALHIWLLLHRLKALPEAAELAQALHDVMMDDMDLSLRELGISDVVIGKRIKLVAENLYGRLQAYDAGLDDSAAFAAALRRNAYGPRAGVPTDDAVAAMIGYCHQQVAALAAQASADLLAGSCQFSALTE